MDSKRELKRYEELKLLERAGQIICLEAHPRFPVTIGGVEIRYPSGRQMVYVADFRYTDVATATEIIEDVKMGSGHLTEVYKIKRALMLAMGLTITETK